MKAADLNGNANFHAMHLDEFTKAEELDKFIKADELDDTSEGRRSPSLPLVGKGRATRLEGIVMCVHARPFGRPTLGGSRPVSTQAAMHRCCPLTSQGHYTKEASVHGTSLVSGPACSLCLNMTIVILILSLFQTSIIVLTMTCE